MTLEDRSMFMQVSQFIANNTHDQPGNRYFVRYGPATRFASGFRNRAQVVAFLDKMMGAFDLDWRSGFLWRVKGYRDDIEIVTRNGERVLV